MHTETAKSYHFAASQRKAHVARIDRDLALFCQSITFGRLPYQPVIMTCEMAYLDQTLTNILNNDFRAFNY